MLKQCPDCRKEGVGPKPINEFWKGNQKGGTAGYCINHHNLRRQIRNASLPYWVSCLYNTKVSAKRLGLSFDLTPEWAKARWTGRCELSNLPFVRYSDGPHPRSPSIDRIDSNLGYLQNNCRFVLCAINSLRLNGTDDEMYEIAAALTTQRSLRCTG